jgi:hypothetical protein
MNRSRKKKPYKKYKLKPRPIPYLDCPMWISRYIGQVDGGVSNCWFAKTPAGDSIIGVGTTRIQAVKHCEEELARITGKPQNGQKTHEVKK